MPEEALFAKKSSGKKQERAGRSIFAESAPAAKPAAVPPAESTPKPAPAPAARATRGGNSDSVISKWWFWVIIAFILVAGMATVVLLVAKPWDNWGHPKETSQTGDTTTSGSDTGSSSSGSSNGSGSSNSSSGNSSSSSNNNSSGSSSSNGGTSSGSGGTGSTGNSTTGKMTWRQFVREYDAWADEYAEFMREYRSDPSALSTSKYLDWVSEATEWGKKVEDLDIDDLSPREQREFSDEVMRIVKKITDAASGK